MFLVFRSTKIRDQAYEAIYSLLPDKDDCVTMHKDISEFTAKWSEGKLSNFEYLSILNSYALRSFNDMT